MQDPNAESTDSTEFTGSTETLDERWNRAILQRAWWVSATERDAQASSYDSAAAERDRQAEKRDRDAATRDEAATNREQIAADRAVAAIKALALADRSDAQRWTDSLAQVEHARAEHARRADEQSSAALQGAEDLSEAVITTLVQAALERDEAREQLAHIAQHLAAAEQDRRSGAEDRAAAGAERQAARRDRNTGRTARHQAAIDRAPDERST